MTCESIIEGVSDVIDDYGKIIVLEDDIEVSKYFEFMNQSLNFYEKKRKFGTLIHGHWV